MPHSFLTAEWRNLVMLNYVVDPAFLTPFVPAGTTLDMWEDRTYVSLVGFLFANTRLLGVPIRFHRTFEEINVRFYVRRVVDGEVRRAVTFLKELVPRAAIARVARMAYNEPYEAVAMRHAFGALSDSGMPTMVHYGWQSASEWSGVDVTPRGSGHLAGEGSEEQFITEHYWGYTRQRDGSTIEYRVAHPPWRVWAVAPPEVRGNLATTYGRELAHFLSAPPHSAFLADGSPVTVYQPTRVPGS